MHDPFENLFIFEMANNHQGSVDHGLRIISEMGRIARTHGIRAAVKFQYRDLDSLIHPSCRDRKDLPHIPRFLSTRLAERDYQTLVQAVRDTGMIPVATPFDEVSVSRCVNHGIDILKVASASATDWPLIEVIAETGRPVIVSTGGIDVYQIDNVVSYLAHKGVPFAILHCVGLYPAPPDALHMDFIQRLRSRYPRIPVGYSGHESPDDLDVVKIAVSKGSSILERHVGVATDTVQLNAYSLAPAQVDRWVDAALKARMMCGDGGAKQIRQEEVDSLRSLMRGVYAKQPIRKGEVLDRSRVFFALPCLEGSQLTSGEFGRYRAVYIASRDYRPLEPIVERLQVDRISLIRNIVHDAKGMLYEAHIETGKDVQIELSHHAGLENFRSTGAVLISVVNRGYCKKLIIVFPGQKHPAHAHRVKEETFQLLWGDLDVVTGDEARTLEPGETMLVEPGHLHSFSSRQGAIFEEISTTHVREDSFYEDPAIDRMDPLQRKTIVDNW